MRNSTALYATQVFAFILVLIISPLWLILGIIRLLGTTFDYLTWGIKNLWKFSERKDFKD